MGNLLTHQKKVQSWIVSAPFDLTFFMGPPLLAVAMVLLVPGLQSPETPVWGWIFFVVFIDVAHVYASLYRTYFDSEEFQRRKKLYLSVPVICFVVGVILYSLGEWVFWRILAYAAVFHFLRQQYGFLMLYRHRDRKTSRLDARIDKLAIYSTMLYPLAFWHQAPSNRNFEWFVQNDFIQLPAWTATATLWMYSASMLLFAGRQIYLYGRYRTVNWGKIGIVTATGAVWYIGIVYLNSDFAFTITNVVAHGVPYMALVWLYGRRKWRNKKDWRTRIHRPGASVLFVALLFVLAYSEEGLWDIFVWQEHASIFGNIQLNMQTPAIFIALFVSLLTVPQATHYVLDAWIWKFDGSNPGLRYYLFLEGKPPEEKAEGGGKSLNP